MVNYKMKKTYISPQFMVITINPMRLIADSSFAKGDGDFDPNNMKFTKEYNNSTNDVNVWDDEW